jgi:hypothetical protein
MCHEERDLSVSVPGVLLAAECKTALARPMWSSWAEVGATESAPRPSPQPLPLFSLFD